jgi:nucleoside-diphosphate-sugar epimerase
MAAHNGIKLTATDIAAPTAPIKGVDLIPADLKDLSSVKRLTAGQDVVVHMGNHANFIPPDPYMIFNENVCMNQNVMQSAADAGVRRVIFASSIQVLASTPFHHKHVTNDQPAYLPIDTGSPENCRNPYGLSKLVGEQMLRYLCRQYDITGRALRFPWLVDNAVEEYSNLRVRRPGIDDCFRPMGFCCLHYDDAVELIIRLVFADISGFGVLIPASRGNLLGMSTQQMVNEFFSQVPLKRRLEDLDGPVDQSAVQRDLAWQPQR